MTSLDVPPTAPMPRPAYQRRPLSAAAQVVACQVELDQLRSLLVEVAAHADRCSVRLELLAHTLQDDQ